MPVQIVQDGFPPHHFFIMFLLYISTIATCIINSITFYKSSRSVHHSKMNAAGSNVENSKQTYSLRLPSFTTQNYGSSIKLADPQVQTLVMNTTYPLRANFSELAIVGLNGSDQTFLPEVQIVQISKSTYSGISLSQTEWEELMGNSKMITKYFEDASNRNYDLISGNGITVSFRSENEHKTLIINKQESEVVGNDKPASITLRKSSWQALLMSQRCINQAILDSLMITEEVKTNFDIISRIVINHLRNTGLDYKSEDYEIIEAINVFLNNLDLSKVKSIEPNMYLLCFNICLFCIPVFVQRFRLCDKFDVSFKEMK